MSSNLLVMITSSKPTVESEDLMDMVAQLSDSDTLNVALFVVCRLSHSKVNPCLICLQ